MKETCGVFDQQVPAKGHLLFAEGTGTTFL